MLEDLIKNKIKSKNILFEHHNKNDGTIQSILFRVTFQELTEICGNRKKSKIIDPPFQIELDDLRCDEMVKSYKNNPHFTLSKMIITIAIIEIGSEKEIYLIDGQHRVEMVKRIYESTEINDDMMIAIHYIKSENEMIELFDDINKDSTKNSKYVKLPIFEKIKMVNIKKEMTKRYINKYSLKKNDDCLYTIDEFIEHLQDSEYFEKKDSLTPIDILDDIDIKHKKFFNELKYLENYKNDKLFTSKERALIATYKNVIFIKNNNFIEYLIDNLEIPYHEYCTIRTSISNTLRLKIWKSEFKSKTSGTCPIIYCNNILFKNKKFGFQCGHIISIANKGNSEEDNLRPICANCNNKMSSTNWNDYEINLKIEAKWESEYDSSDDGECYKCDRMISKYTCYLIKEKKKEILVCKKCIK